jgi:hypothetical protein
MPSTMPNSRNGTSSQRSGFAFTFASMPLP